MGEIDSQSVVACEIDPGSGQVDTAHQHSPFMPMTLDDFERADIEQLSGDAWVNFMRMKVRRVRDRDEPDDAREYFDDIEAALEEAYETVTLDTIRDPEQMNHITCVDKNSSDQLDEQDFKPQERIRVPGGLGYFDATGLMREFIAARLFNKKIAAGMHIRCGLFAITGTLTDEGQARRRSDVIVSARDLIADAASVARNLYLRKHGGQLSTQERAAVRAFQGPKLVIEQGTVGTAAPFVTPAHYHERDVDKQFTPDELNVGVEGWINHYFASGINDNQGH